MNPQYFHSDLAHFFLFILFSDDGFLPTELIMFSLHVGFDTSILPICKDSLGWMFNRLDTNYDLLLDQSELGSIYLDKNEQCTKAFFNSCDTYKDSLISNNEWCYCFQRQQGKSEATTVGLVVLHFNFYISLILKILTLTNASLIFVHFF